MRIGWGNEEEDAVRIGVGGGPNIPEGRDINVTWPRQEKRSVGDSAGGWLQDCMVKVGQGAWIFLITCFGLIFAVLTGWAMPPEVWWLAITVAYFLAVLGIPAWIVVIVMKRRDWIGMAGSGMAFVLFSFAAVKGFDVFIWDPLDTLTRGFFTFKLPVVNGWCLLMLIFFGLVVISALVKNSAGIGGGLFGTFGSLAVWLATCEFMRPSLMFYVLLGVLDIAYFIAAFGLPRIGDWAPELGGTVGVLQHEQADVYEPYGSASPEEPEYKPPPETRFINVTGGQSHRGLEPADRLIHVVGPKGEEWVACERNMIYFIENLPLHGIKQRGWADVRLPSGLLLVDKSTGEVGQKDAPITQWAHWAVYVHFLQLHGLYNIATRKFSQDVIRNGQPDPELILQKLGLLAESEWEPLPIEEEG